jgi:hypothetical protein
VASFRKGELSDTDSAGHTSDRLDWYMLNFGPVALFRKPEVVHDTVGWLEGHGYRVGQAECGACGDTRELLWAIGAALGFHRWDDPGLDGFNDDCHHLQAPHDGGLAIVLWGFDRAAARLPEDAKHVLDILAWASWNNLLYGRRFICMVQSDDPHLQFGAVGGRKPWWNQREWFIADRTG